MMMMRVNTESRLKQLCIDTGPLIVDKNKLEILYNAVKKTHSQLWIKDSPN